MRKLILAITIVTTLINMSGVFEVPTANAMIRPVIVSKIMNNNTLSNAERSSIGVATLTKSTEVITVTLFISNPEDTINSVTITDYLGDSGTANRSKLFTLSGTINQYKVNTGGVCDGNSSSSQLVNVAGSDVNYLQFNTDKLQKGTQYCIQYSLVPSAAMFPTFKGRLVGYPVYVTQPSSLTESLSDIGYLYVNPVASSSLTGSLFNSGNNFDLGVLMPGLSVKVVEGGPAIKDLTTPPTFYLQPNSETSVTARSGEKQCGISIEGAGSRSRGGGCVFSTTAAVYNTGQNVVGSELDTTNAYFMALPSSTIIGNVFAGSSSGFDSSKLLLPGEHVAGGTVPSATARSSENIGYIIDQNSVSGWNPSSSNLYKNVYQTANIARLTRNPNLLIQSTTPSCTIGFPNTTCSTTTSGSVTTTTWTISNSAANFCINLGSKNLSCSTSIPQNKDGYVVYVKGNLVLGSTTSSSVITMTNQVTGTIIVDGNLTINNLSIAAGSAPLGLVVLGKDGVKKAAIWNTNRPIDSTLDLVSFFVPAGTFQAVKTSNSNLVLNGSIVADTVDLSGVKPGKTEDSSGIVVKYPQALSQNPPPGFNLFSASPILNDTSP